MAQSYIADIEQFTAILRNYFQVPIPVDPSIIVTKLGGKVEDKDIEEDREARLLKTSATSFTIEIKIGTSHNRRKFSIAHELGHLFLHWGFLTDIGREKWNHVNVNEESAMYRYGYSKEEKEANDFAGSLLMPKYEFIRVAEQNYDETNNVYKLKPISDHFKVSIDAVRIRGRYLQLFSWE